MVFSCPTGENPQLQHNNNNYDFDQPINVSVTSNECTISKITYSATITIQYFDVNGNPGQPNTFTIEGVRWVRLPASVFVRVFELNNAIAWHLILKHRGYSYQGCLPYDLEAILSGGSGLASASGTAQYTFDEGITNYVINVKDEDDNLLLEIPTNNPDYNLICIPDSSPPEGCPPGTLDCSDNGSDCCDCSTAFNELSSIRKLISEVRR